MPFAFKYNWFAGNEWKKALKLNRSPQYLRLDIVCTFFLVKAHVPEVSPSRCDLDPQQLSLPVDLMEEGRPPVVLADEPDKE